MSALSDTHLQDVGLFPDSYYRNRMNPVVYRLRALLRPLIDREVPLIEHIQSCHTPYLDWFFMWTANLGSHTFYVLLLPFPSWFGAFNLTRDLVQVLGLGIYFSGLVKDILCLPRPSSPPVKRLTLSHYTSKEYGCPSSHSANATAVTLIGMAHLLNNTSPLFTTPLKALVALLLAVYWACLVFGRIYCGMHGLVDVVLGSLMGVLVALWRLGTKSAWDYQLLNSASFLNSIPAPLAVSGIALAYYTLIYFHAKPLEQCPCFEDSIAFVAVLLGLDLGSLSLTSLDLPLPSLYTRHRGNSNYDLHNSTLLSTLARFVVGISCVVCWKAVSKPLFTKLIHRLRGESKDCPISCFAYMSKFDTRILVKLIVYSGIAVVVLYTNSIFSYLNI